MIEGISRRGWLAAVLTALSIVQFSVVEGAEDSIVSGPPKGMLSASRKHIVVGDTVRLLLIISGGGDLSKWVFEQPTLTALAHLDLLAVSQRNALSFRSGGRVFTTAFLYSLKARSPGVEKIPQIQVKCRDGKGAESRTVTVEGLEITIGEGRSIGRRTIALVILVIAVGAIVFVTWRMRKR
ncbi:MAG: BatD family protein [bacterium]